MSNNTEMSALFVCADLSGSLKDKNPLLCHTLSHPSSLHVYLTPCLTPLLYMSISHPVLPVFSTSVSHTVSPHDHKDNIIPASDPYVIPVCTRRLCEAVGVTLGDHTDQPYGAGTVVAPVWHQLPPRGWPPPNWPSRLNKSASLSDLHLLSISLTSEYMNQFATVISFPFHSHLNI